MTTDYHTFHFVCIATQSLRQEIFETWAIQSTTHTDDSVLRQAQSFQWQISHGIHRVGDNHKDSIRRIFQDVLCNRLNDTCINTNQFFTSHTRLTRNTWSDNNNIRVCCFFIIVSATNNVCVEAQQLSCLHHIHCFTFWNAFFNVQHYYFVCYFIESKYICTCSTYVTCAYYGYFWHNLYFI